jgi:hypothetical protein
MKMFSVLPPRPYGTFESQSRVGARKSVFPYHDVLHAARKFGADDETAMSVIHGVVHNQDVFARTSVYAAFAGTAFHADAVIANIQGVVHDEHILAVTDIHAVAVLGIPWHLTVTPSMMKLLQRCGTM